MSKKLTTASAVMTALAAVMAVLLLSITPAFAHHRDDHTQGGGQDSTTTSEEQSSQGAENTPGNDRKEGYEDNSDTPQEPNHGRGSDHDGDADSDPNTAYEDDHTTADAGDNAHPSGKDRSVENGGSGNQGKSESNPDDSKGPMRYEGVQGDDKPGGPGGTDLADQDGNNGCGNDDDFNDDNNGWCGKTVRSTEPTKVKPSDTNHPEPTKTCPEDGSMVQGKSCSEPDNDGRGPDRNESGRDKVEDGNNGCGNDVDGMDDSEGWCGNKPQEEVAADVITETCPEGTVMDADGNCLEVSPSVPEDTVLGADLEKDKAAAKPEAGPSVLGIRLSPALNQPVKVAGAVLPFTGGDVLIFLVLALALFASGALIMNRTGKAHQEG